MICRVGRETGWRISSEKPDRSLPGIALPNCLTIQRVLALIQRLFNRQNNIIAWGGDTGPMSRFSGLFAPCGSRIRGRGLRRRHLPWAIDVAPGAPIRLSFGLPERQCFLPGNGRAASVVAETACTALFDIRNCLMWFLG